MKDRDWAALDAKLEGIARTPEEAEAVLEHLAAGLFPEGAAEMIRLTWPEEKPSRLGALTQETTEARLREAEARFRTLIEQIPAVTFMAVLGEGKNEIYVSPHIEQMLGYTQEEWLENPFLWYWQLHPEDRTIWHEEFARGCQTGGPFRAECRFLARDGHEVWVHGEAKLIKDEIGRPMFLQGVAFDITESKRVQKILLNEAVRSAKIEEELEIARRVQTSILPRNLEVPGLAIAASMEPASEVGGDYYDILPFDGGCWIAIGDVSGHGLNAGLVMLMVQSAMATLAVALPTCPPSQLWNHLNTVLFDNIRKRLCVDDHVTFSLLRYTRDGRVAFTGSHEDMLLCRCATRKVEVIRSPGTWLGAGGEVRRADLDTTMRLDVGDLLILYTDGITEAMNAAGEQFDIDRLTDVIERAQDESVETIRDRVLAAIHGWMKKQYDDISIVVLRYQLS